MAASTAHIVPTVVGGVDEKTLGELVSLQKQVEVRLVLALLRD